MVQMSNHVRLGHLTVRKIAGLPLHKEPQQPDVAEDGSPEEPWRTHCFLLQFTALLEQQAKHTNTHKNRATEITYFSDCISKFQ